VIYSTISQSPYYL